MGSKCAGYNIKVPTDCSLIDAVDFLIQAEHPKLYVLSSGHQKKQKTKVEPVPCGRLYHSGSV